MTGKPRDDELHPKGDEWFTKPLSDHELDRLYKMASAQGGGSSRSTGLYQLSMVAGLAIFTTLGWRILAELGRVRRALGGTP